MKKWLGKIVIVCIAAAVPGGCAREDGTGLEDIRLSIAPGEKGGDRNDAPESGQGEWGKPGADGILGEDGQESQEGAGILGSNQGGGVSGSRESGEASGENSQGNFAQSGGKETDPESAAMIEAYITVLEDIFFDQKFPGGQDYGYQPVQEYDVATNQFAVYDIDGDGKEELLITWSTTYTAGQGEIVYGFDSDTGSVIEELRAYPLLTYYDNGIVEEQMSHNHGMAPDGDFWPYLLHQYDGQTDRYTVIASVDAWSRAYREEDYDGNPFPEKIDADGDGMVYYTMEGGIYALENPLDGAEYQLWRDSYIKGAQPVKVPYVKLTPDNIYALGARTSGISEGQNKE